MNAEKQQRAVHEEACSGLPAEVSAIGARGQAGDPAERRAESARVFVSDGKANIGHRYACLASNALACSMRCLNW